MVMARIEYVRGRLVEDEVRELMEAERGPDIGGK